MKRTLRSTSFGRFVSSASEIDFGMPTFGVAIYSAICAAFVCFAYALSSQAATVATVRPLAIHRTAVPPLEVAGYPTLIVEGVYPRVSRRGLDLAKVNQHLRGAVVDEERRWAHVLESVTSQIPASRRRSLHGGFGLSVKWSLLSASTAVVSALLPLNECVPGATGCDFWFSITVQVPSGRAVMLPQLFANPQHGLRRLARVAEASLIAKNGCIARYPAHEGFAPTWRHYRSWALTSSGIAIGFDTSQVGSPYCGSVRTIVPYERIAPYLSALGRHLVDGVRSPGPRLTR